MHSTASYSSQFAEPIAQQVICRRDQKPLDESAHRAKPQVMTEQEDVRTLREAIDETDDAILALIERRLALAREMAAAKQGNSDFSPLRPVRETAILERLRVNARVASPRLIEIVWRELIGQGRQAQGPMKLVLFTRGDGALLEECARRHFSSAIAVEWAESREAALQAASQEPVIAAVDGKTDDAELTDLGEIRSSAGRSLGFAYARVQKGAT